MLTAPLIVLVVLVVLTLVLVLWIAGIYNRLVLLRNRFKNAWAQIDVQLKRRYDLIPNLVETAKGYMAHEKGTLEAVIAARNQAVSAQQKASMNPAAAGAVQGVIGAEGMLTGALSKLFAVVEAYPNLKADQNMLALQEELTSTENKIAFARQAYNDAVNSYNTYKQSFPPVLLAGMFGFADATFFEIENPTERQAPQVKF